MDKARLLAVYFKRRFLKESKGINLMPIRRKKEIVYILFSKRRPKKKLANQRKVKSTSSLVRLLIDRVQTQLHHYWKFRNFGRSLSSSPYSRCSWYDGEVKLSKYYIRRMTFVYKITIFIQNITRVSCAPTPLRHQVITLRLIYGPIIVEILL